MKPTVDFIKKNFDRFNKKYFHGILPEALIEVSTTSRALGDCRAPSGHDPRYRLRVSNFYDRTERDLQQTILHEMVHMYVHIKYGRMDHGLDFKNIARELKVLGGWEITRTTKIDEDVRQAAPARRPRQRRHIVVLFLDINNHTHPYQIALLTHSRYRNLLQLIENNSGFVVLGKGIATDSAFDKYITSRTHLTYYSFTADELKKEHPAFIEFLKLEI